MISVDVTSIGIFAFIEICMNIHVFKQGSLVIRTIINLTSLQSIFVTKYEIHNSHSKLENWGLY